MLKVPSSYQLNTHSARVRFIRETASNINSLEARVKALEKANKKLQSCVQTNARAAATVSQSLSARLQNFLKPKKTSKIPADEPDKKKP